MKYVTQYEKNGEFKKYDSIVLMSRSPRRLELLNFLNPISKSVEIDERSVEEEYMNKYADKPFFEKAAVTCCELAKAKSGNEKEEGSLYISSDTMVIHNDRIYNKPKNESEAKDMLMSYFGCEHKVVTSVCLRMGESTDVFYTTAIVKFSDYNKEFDKIIDEYIKSGKSFDKAGAYGIQELDPRLIEYIEGDLNTIIGFPVAETIQKIYAII